MGTKVLLISDPLYKTDFDSGSLEGLTIDGIIDPQNSFNYYWWWYAFSSRKFGGKTPTFKINRSYYFQTAANIYRFGCYATSLDTDNWIDFGTPTIGSTYIQFTATSPLPSGKLYFAHMPIYPFLRVARKVTEWRTHAYVSDTTSSTNGILGYSTQRINTLDGKVIPSLPFYGFKLSKNSGYTKNVAVLSGGLHPGESIGRFAFEGAMDWLTGGSTEAEVLLDWFDFYIYPCLCPDGIYAGLFRGSPQNLTLDYNRNWNTAGALEGIDLLKTAMPADTNSVVDVVMDFHCSNNSTVNNGQNYANAISPSAGKHPEYQAIMKTLDSTNFNLVTFDYSGTYLRFCTNTYDAQRLVLCVHPEISGRLEYSVSDIKTYGENNLKAIYQMLLDGDFPNHPAGG